ncbi:MAG: hypothetical protein DRN65_04965, partial [Thaumarchaeota archaeon]
MKLRESLVMIAIGLIAGSLLTLAVLNLQHQEPSQNLPGNCFSCEVPASGPEEPRLNAPRIEEFKQEYSRKRWMGYDVFLAYEYYVR